MAISLPIGVRDFLPRAAARRRAIVGALMAAFERWGYARVVTPSFEYEEVFERGGADPRQLIRFVEPTSARVAALRPDFTPQVARLAATRLRDAPPPLRLFYQGSVLRLPRGAEPQRELVQAGVELVGAASPGGDVEVVSLCAEALAGAGLARPHLDIGHSGLVRAALADAPSLERDHIRTLLGRKARAGLAALPVPARLRRRLAAVAALYGGREVLARARRLGAAGRHAADEVARVLDGLPPELRDGATIDLGEVRGFDYYTGVRFAFYLDGIGDPVACGGRYDGLLARFGWDAPATGFAVDVERCARSLDREGAPEPAAGGTLCVGPGRAELAASLRRAGKRAVAFDGRAAAAYGRAWGYAWVAHARRSGVRVEPLAGKE